MYCSKCGKQIEDDARFCPHCGAENQAQETVSPPSSSAAPISKADKPGEVGKPDEPDKNKSIPAQIQSYEEHTNKWSKKQIITAASVLAVVAVIIVLLTLPLNDDRSKLISLVQNGYLGNYDTVTVKEVLEYSFDGGEWNAGEALNGKSYIVEYKANGVTIQFSVPEIGANTFTVSGIGFDGEASGWTAYETKSYLDMMYEYYAEEHRGCGVVVDESTSNDTLQGHAR